nr:T9SS type A sorting domain-containing protein [uncultured Flavobacterium sp.]
MKKTLLCFLFLLPTLIFAQISSIIHCAGDNVFDLTSRYDELTKDINLNPGETITIKYYTKDTYAIYDENAVVDPKNYVFTGGGSLEIHVRIKRSGGASIMNSFTIILNHAIEFANASVSYPQCGNSRVYLAARYGRSPFKYSLDGVKYQSENAFNNVAPGSYNIHIKDDYGCTKDSTLVVPAINALTATSLKINNSCYGSNDGRIEITPIGGTPTYSYSKNGSSFQQSNIFSNLAAGHYDITVKDGIGCLYVFPIDIAQPTILSASTTAINVTNPGGNDGEITVVATGGTPTYFYRLNNPNGIITPWQNSNIFKNLTGGNYIVEIIDAQGCMVMLPIIVNTPPSQLAIIASVSDANCYTTFRSITINAIGGAGSYLYSIDGIPYNASNVFPNVSPGLHTLWVKDSLNSLTSMDITVPAYLPLSATATATKIENCAINYISTIKITASGGTFPYQYAVNSSSYQQSDTFSGAAPGEHIINVKDAYGCVFTTKLIIESPVSLTASATVNEPRFCGDKGSVTIKAAGGQEPYSYSFNQGSSYSDINTKELDAGYYTLFAKDASGCIVSQVVTVTASNPPSAIFISSTNTTAPNSNDGNVTVRVNGGTMPYSYSIRAKNNPVGNFLQSSNVFTFVNLAPGEYDITVKDAKDCLSQTIRVIIVAPSFAPLTATAEVVRPTCLNPMGVITVHASGGSGVYQYSFDNGTTYSSTNTYATTSPGIYRLTVRDDNNIVYTLILEVTQPIPMILNATIFSPVTCAQNGTIMAHAISGQSPITYSLNGGPFSQANIFENLVPGSYFITAKDNNGCTETLTITLATPTPITASVNVENQTATINASGSNTELKYAISPNLDRFSNQNVFPNLAPGNYTAIIQDLSGCFEMLNFIVDPVAPVINGKTAVNVEFKQGQTLGDLAIEGQNIKWYSTPGTSSTGKTSKATAETPLPKSTVLVDGVTYYASQTINGIESKTRLAVTAKVNGSLSTPDFELADFKFYPNPVKHILSVKNKSVIEDIQVFAVSGQSVLFRKVNSTNAEIDLSNLSKGMYILNVKSDGKEKAFKFIKE